MLAFILTAFVQVAVLPWLSGEVARSYPEVADLRWPVLAIAVAMLLCFEIVLISTWALVRAVDRSRIFDHSAIRWVDRIVSAIGWATVLAFGLLAVLVDSSAGPITVPAVGLLLVLALATVFLIVTILRKLLVQAASIKGELDEVV